ncbi:stabilizer of axonemal microtubules 1-like isoform X1 [Hylaeus anthracinus]|uniref:stabilizer of axonemal microtubules 1-like isoform X1 n=2 Tax=Hylaeus anthracinus TaxID=313031 RepID=UPI0023B97EB3|nr:stabilizer of axonemal microtubules 1-like isoform X1 [Hylaeus anthracinus]XP_053997969.1 stabilizer of axonemal microtubules 1-like isoform X1 [Hylaeus anthracinus]
MQICTFDPPARTQPQSVIEAKNKLRLDHDESCNCCCCCTPQSPCLKYVQPKVPKSFAPIRYYWKSNIPMDKNTTYQLSYWECPTSTVEPIRLQNWLTTGEGEISDKTTYKDSYFGNWCITPEQPITPCSKQWLGRGPIQDVTTQKHDYTWKSMEPVQAFKAQQNLYCPAARLADDTTYRLSYYPSACHLPATSYAPIRKYARPDIPMDDCTTYRLSYWPNDGATKAEQPWYTKREYIPPVEPLDGCTTYKLSYWPHCEEIRQPIRNQENDNLLNAGCCSDNNTTYRLSYFGSEGGKRDPIRQPNNILFSPCPAAYDTVNRMSFLGNWCVKPETAITPCSKQMLGGGPMQEVTTQKHDYTWKNIPVEQEIRPENNLITANACMDCCTTHRLSYIPNCKSLTPVQSYAPVRRYSSPSVPMLAETTMQLSYQPVDVASPVEKPWSDRPSYYPPVTPMEDNTTYNNSYIPPGTLVPQCTC